MEESEIPEITVGWPETPPPPAWTRSDAVFANLVIGWIGWSLWTEGGPLPFLDQVHELLFYSMIQRTPTPGWAWPDTILLCVGLACLARGCWRLLRWAPRRPLVPRPRTWRQVVAATAIVPVVGLALGLNGLWLICCPGRVVACATAEEAVAAAGWEPVMVRLPSGSFAGQFPFATDPWWRAQRSELALPETVWGKGGDEWNIPPLALIEQPRGWHPYDQRVKALDRVLGLPPGDRLERKLAAADPYDGSARMFRGLNRDDGFTGVIVVRPVPWRIRDWRWNFKHRREPPTPWFIARLVPESTVRSFAVREGMWAWGMLAGWMVGIGMMRRSARWNQETAINTEYGRDFAAFSAARDV